MTTTTYSTLGYQRLHELELIDDSICDMYMRPQLWAEGREEQQALKNRLGKIIEDLHAWRDKYNENI